jgi:hypothetical protein
LKFNHVIQSKKQSRCKRHRKTREEPTVFDYEKQDDASQSRQGPKRYFQGTLKEIEVMVEKRFSQLIYPSKFPKYP